MLTFKYLNMKKYLLFIFTVLCFKICLSQSTNGSFIVRSAVPFLTINPDARSGGIGETGVATQPDNNSQYWNPAKYAFCENKAGITYTYSPWLRNFIPDFSFIYSSGYIKIGNIQALGASIRHLDFGSTPLYNEGGGRSGSTNPNEFSIDMSYSRKLSDYLSGAISARYIRSDVYNGDNVSEVGNSFASDIALYFNKKVNKSYFAGGLNISNIGTKISYDSGITRDFIPTNLRLGGNYAFSIGEKYDLGFSLDLNKLLVPNPVYDNVNDRHLLSQLGNQDIGSIKGIFVSFTDASGGFLEELSEITYSFGAECVINNFIDLRKYKIDNSAALRLGYSNESEKFGDRKFITFGLGWDFNLFSIIGGSMDLSYIYTLKRISLLENTIRMTLGININ